VAVAPNVGPRQTVVIFLNELPGSVSPPTDRAYTLPVPGRKESDPPAPSVSVRFRNIAIGFYLLRVQVDGATSALVSDPTTGLFIDPVVEVHLP
jgi:hypothetical protein